MRKAILLTGFLDIQPCQLWKTGGSTGKRARPLEFHGSLLSY
jgi:hypothetical protein